MVKNCHRIPSQQDLQQLSSKSTASSSLAGAKEDINNFKIRQRRNIYWSIKNEGRNEHIEQRKKLLSRKQLWKRKNKEHPCRN